MSVAINGPLLRRELAVRGWTNSDLARAARISHATVSAACAGRPVSAVTVRLILEALVGAPPLQHADQLIM